MKKKDIKLHLLRRYLTQSEAHIIQSKLKSYGIRSEIVHDTLATVVTTGLDPTGVELWVEEKNAEQAEEILRELND